MRLPMALSALVCDRLFSYFWQFGEKSQSYGHLPGWFQELRLLSHPIMEMLLALTRVETYQFHLESKDLYDLGSVSCQNIAIRLKLILLHSIHNLT